MSFNLSFTTTVHSIYHKLLFTGITLVKWRAHPMQPKMTAHASHLTTRSFQSLYDIMIMPACRPRNTWSVDVRVPRKKKLDPFRISIVSDVGGTDESSYFYAKSERN